MPDNSIDHGTTCAVYRSLERECRIQAALTEHKEAREELARMEREYKLMADLESHQQ